MPRYLIKRPHPAKTPMKAGQIVENPQWKNLDYLISRGYVEQVDDEAPAEEVAPQEDAELLVEIEDPIEIVESPAVTPAKKKK